MNPDLTSEATAPSAHLDATIRVDVRATLPAGIEQPGDVVGRYHLVELLGEGGFGSVWLAEQHEPIRREVALKVIKPGMDSREIIARFEAERQALALMDHPNIAGVLDAGTTSNGRPYFVMELVKGAPVTEYCDAHHLTIRQRLELFIPVCQAVQHAHQKAILHRDLKPSNILVSEVDGKLVPKVIDFGIAKALGTSPEAALKASLLQTQAGAIIGTPQYMSPEQAGAAQDLDTRSDIYTLGVILFELLTGDTPLSRDSLGKAALDEILRQVREAEPKRPSSRVQPITDEVQQNSTARRTDPTRLGRTLRGDLDWITLKALEKDRDRRYGSAAALAQELERHLNNEPVEAGPPGAIYRLKKLARRNKGAFAAATAIAASLVVGFVCVAWALVQEARQRAIAEQALADLKNTAPTFHAQAESLLQEARFAAALEKIGYAIQLDPENAGFRLFRANLSQAMQDLPAAAAEYERVIVLNPSDQAAKTNLALCKRLIELNGAGPALGREAQKQLLLALRAQGRLVEAGPLNRIFNEDVAIAEAALRAALRDCAAQAGWKDDRVTRLSDGTFQLDLSHLKIADLAMLQGHAISKLDLSQDVLADGRLVNLAGLAALPLRELNLSGTDVADLAPLKGAPLEVLDLSYTSVTGLVPLAGMRMKKLVMTDTLVTSLDGLVGVPLEHLDCSRSAALADISALKGAPLAWLSLWRTAVENLDAIAGSPLRHLNARETRIASLKPLENCRSLEELDISRTQAGLLDPLGGLKLKSLFCSWNKVRKVEALSGHPLRFLDLQGLIVTDLKPLLACRSLEEVVLPEGVINPGMLLELPALRRISKRLSGAHPAQTKEEFAAELRGTAAAPAYSASQESELSPAEQIALRTPIATMEVKDMPLSELIELLETKMKEHDETGAGVRIMLDPGLPSQAAQLRHTLKWKDTNAMEVLSVITSRSYRLESRGRTFLILPAKP